MEKDDAYCFYCFLFKSASSSVHFGHDAFTISGFKNWKKGPEHFRKHIGGTNIIHNNARRYCEDFRNQKQSVSYAIACDDDKSS